MSKDTRILIVDDFQDIRDVARRILESDGYYQISDEVDGMRALQLIGLRYNLDSPFDLVITDVEMPVMDGYELIREIRSHDDPSINGVKILATTGNGGAAVKARLLDAGADGYLEKPYSVFGLLGAVERVMGDTG